MIDLSNSMPFAKGGKRACYQHPNNKNICLKITHAGLPNQLKKKLLGIKNIEVLIVLMTTKEKNLLITKKLYQKMNQ